MVSCNVATGDIQTAIRLAVSSQAVTRAWNARGTASGSAFRLVCVVLLCATPKHAVRHAEPLGGQQAEHEQPPKRDEQQHQS
jgi:hypothetical protein